MGGAAVAEGVIGRPEGVAGLVLVAPAIVALWASQPAEARGDAVTTGLAVVEELVGPEDDPGTAAALSSSDSNTSGLWEGEDGGECSPSSSDVRASGAAGAAIADSRQRRRHLPRALRRAPRVAAALLQAALFSALRWLLLLLSPALVAALRHVVRREGFWERGLRAAWHRKEGVTRQLVDGYRLGMLAS